jgi:hypothetical protein
VVLISGVEAGLHIGHVELHASLGLSALLALLLPLLLLRLLSLPLFSLRFLSVFRVQLETTVASDDRFLGELVNRQEALVVAAAKADLLGLASLGCPRSLFGLGVEGITGRKGHDLRGDGLLPAPLSPPLQRFLLGQHGSGIFD